MGHDPMIDTIALAVLAVSAPLAAGAYLAPLCLAFARRRLAFRAGGRRVCLDVPHGIRDVNDLSEVAGAVRAARAAAQTPTGAVRERTARTGPVESWVEVGPARREVDRAGA